MTDRIVTEGGGGALGKFGKFLAVAAGVLLVAGVGVWKFLDQRPIASPATVIGAPVRATSPSGERVVLLTSQWKTFRPYRRGTSSTAYTDLLIDVWGFDAVTGKPAWRQRLESDRHGVNMGRALLGADGGVLWVLGGKGLVGLSLADGAVVADTARIEAANPKLKGMLPTEERYYRFDAGGLGFTAADGRAWRLDGKSLRAQPDAGHAIAKPGVALPAGIAGGNGTYVFQERGLLLGRRWLGLLDAREVPAFQAGGAIGGLDPANHPRTRLWSAQVGKRGTFFGPRPTFSAFAPLPESPEFLNAGLLARGSGSNEPPILLFKPDSVLVLHLDRLGDEGRWRLSRVAGPGGRVVWTAELPLNRLEAVMPGDRSLALLGSRPEPGPRGPSHKERTDVHQLVTLDLATGARTAYGFKVKATEAKDIPPSSTE